MFTNKKREGRNTFVSAVSLYVAKTPKASIKEHEPHYPIIPCRNFPSRAATKGKLPSVDYFNDIRARIFKKNCG